MIIVSKDALNEQQLRDITKNYLGIRYRTNPDGSFEAYANALTVFADIIHWIKRQIA
jgi:hypothetical protein